MASFLEKLKKGVGIELPSEEKAEEVEEKAREKRVQKPKKFKVETKMIEPEIKKVAREKEKPSFAKAVGGKEKEWFESEGQLAVDVYQTDGELVIQATIAGVKPEDLDISSQGDVVIIRGRRERPARDEQRNYFYQECYWGPFSREIILPVEADPARAEASMVEGVLTIRMPKIEKEKKKKIVVKK